MIRLLILLLLPLQAMAQTSDVDPADLSLTVTVEDTGHIPFARELVMITVKGVYRRHIAREELEQPKLEGFNWTQLGPDIWTEERIRGQKAKVLLRRMALYPERSGTLEIGAFTHHLTLFDESDKWFTHDIASAPITLEVAPTPALEEGDWWFPVKRLEISDSWSNAPDQLAPGEGVLRVIRLEALGVTPEMMPPMPELTSPSGMVFAHPEKRLVDLTSQGPVTYAFWRYTIQPTNGRSAMVEPLQFNYFDTTLREMRRAEISAQRVAYDAGELPPVPPPERPVTLPGWPLALLGLMTLAGLMAAGLRGQTPDRRRLFLRLPLLDRQARRLRRAARAGDLTEARRAARAMMLRDGVQGHEVGVLDGFDRTVFGRRAKGIDLPRFARDFLRARSRAGRGRV